MTDAARRECALRGRNGAATITSSTGLPDAPPNTAGISVRAENFATTAHRAIEQTDKQDRDYVEHHLRPVAEKLAPYGPEVMAAGWLHDVVEDTEASLDDLRSAGFPEPVVSAVDSVTRRSGEEYLGGLIERACSDRNGVVVKLADNERNLEENADLYGADPATADRLLRRYLPARRRLLAAADTFGIEWCPSPKVLSLLTTPRVRAIEGSR